MARNAISRWGYLLQRRPVLCRCSAESNLFQTEIPRLSIPDEYAVNRGVRRYNVLLLCAFPCEGRKTLRLLKG